MGDTANPDVPISPELIEFKHPANGDAFLLLAANNIVQTVAELGSQPAVRTFGVHYSTALVACRILTNEPGFFSSSGNRNAHGRVPDVDPDRILVLQEYYYHLTVPQADPLYPICLDFDLWQFPQRISSAWERTVSATEENPYVFESWTAISATIKFRDVRCRLSGWRDGLSTAHIIPKEHEVWVCSPEFAFVVF